MQLEKEYDKDAFFHHFCLIYIQKLFKEALAEETSGIKINRKIINNLRYADDTVVIADKLSTLQNMIDRIMQYSEQFGLFMNVSKTKVMVFSKSKVNATLKISGDIVEQVSSLKYLGAVVNEQCNPKIEIKSRMEQDRRTFLKMKKFFIRSDTSLQLRIRMVRCYVFSVFLYGCKCWTLDYSMEKRIDVFEIYIYRRMLRISWVQRITNIEILNRVQKQKELMITIKERKTNYIGHVLRREQYELLRLIIEGKIKKKSIGRRQNLWLKDIRR